MSFCTGTCNSFEKVRLFDSSKVKASWDSIDVALFFVGFSRWDRRITVIRILLSLSEMFSFLLELSFYSRLFSCSAG